MLSSLQDITGLFPGLFQRGQSAAAAEEAARGQAEAVPLDPGRHGRDSLRLSPEARALEQVAAEDDEAGAAAATERGSALGPAGGFIRQALETIRHDLAKALQAFGFDSSAIQNFSKAFVEPVLSALKEGANFTAELSFAAFSQVTTLSSNGDFSQSTSLVAQSLSIEVNQDTGEVSVSLAKLSFEQEIRSGQGAVGDGQQPLLVIDPDDLASPRELAAKILASGEATVEAAPTAAERAPLPDEEAAEQTVALPQDLEDKLATLRERLTEEGAALQTRLTIHSVTRHRNDKGETVTRLLLDAQLEVARLAEVATAQEEAESLDFTA